MKSTFVFGINAGVTCNTKKLFLWENFKIGYINSCELHTKCLHNFIMSRQPNIVHKFL